MDKPKRILKPDVTSDEVRIYEAYLQRIQKEYDLIWSRFKIYFGFNSGLLVIIGLLLQPYLASTYFNVPGHILSVISLLSLIGIIFSIAWLLVNRDGRKWMFLMNDVIEKVESHLFDDVNCALYMKIVEKSKQKTYFMDIDVTAINLILSRIFVIIWLLLIVLSTVKLLC